MKNEKLKIKSEESTPNWYDLTGRRYNSKPTKPGLYINGGKKVVVIEH